MIKLKVRAIVGVMIFLGYFMVYVVRYNICVHIVDMAKLKYRIEVNVQNKTDLNFEYTVELYSRDGATILDSMSWDDMAIARLFSAYHIGYCICFPIFHTMGDKLGPTWVVGIAGFTSGVMNCLTPASVYYNYWLLFVVRIIEGFCAGAMQPSMVQLLRHWVPPIERNYFMWAYCGTTTGTCFTFFACAAVHYYSHWPVGFYTSGSCQILWAILWVLIVTDSPRKHNFISKEELEYLVKTVGAVFGIKVTNAQIPWHLILKSKSFWALCCLNYGYAWMIIALCIHGTLYYSRVVGYSLYSAAALTGLPFFFRLVLGTIVMHTFHWYKYNENITRIKHIRKYIVIVSHVSPGLLVMSTWLTTSVVPGPILLTIAVALTAAGMDLTLDLCYEISPTFVNPIHTVIKIIGNTPGIIVSYLVGAVIMKFQNSAYVWKHTWCFHATVLFLSGLVFLLWGDTNIQPWNAVKHIPRRHRIKPVASLMSNIMEVDEEETSTRLSIQQKKINFLSGPFRSSQIK
ncbi:sialin-like isoform X1 [Choristoneura fumiferana]|uniref:sialin-like isoform X1 n=1 Tax=Choristoneura fumiferana TaxID=7141 RepID=UPI003D15C4A5